jgi:hypothetical protein
MTAWICSNKLGLLRSKGCVKRKPLIRQLKSLTSKQFCDRFLADDDAFLFSSNHLETIGDYQQFRAFVAGRFDVNHTDIMLVGSSKVGFSLRPGLPTPLPSFRKNASPTNSESDIDLVIANPDLFEECWSALLSGYYGGLGYFENHKSEIFRRFVSFRSDSTYPVKALSSFIQLIGEIKRDLTGQFRITRPINYRLYRTMEDAMAYHCYGIEQLQKELT